MVLDRHDNCAGAIVGDQVFKLPVGPDSHSIGYVSGTAAYRHNNTVLGSVSLFE